ncbi:hypothetical protein RU99_GL002304 [Enterococcus casseliflavus]|nr:hypothetical protein RU99_GL002304 [Enterococcus casseliflavus]
MFFSMNKKSLYETFFARLNEHWFIEKSKAVASTAFDFFCL